jgi:hypothetical protein
MARLRILFLTTLCFVSLIPHAMLAQTSEKAEVSGSLVALTVDVDDVRAPLYRAVDGSGRYYLEAHEGSRYALNISNESAERLGVVVVVDGLNAITGQIQRESGRRKGSNPGRMYVLDPWGRVTVQGWRTSLDDVRRFTFVDEQASYASRSDKANGKMGWIEILVYRERERQPDTQLSEGNRSSRRRTERDDEPVAGESNRPAPKSDPQASPAPEDAGGYEAPSRRSYPGTGWGPRANDPVIVVEFEPERQAAERLVLRYEYRNALIALGVLPRSVQSDGRLAQREWGNAGFAQPPGR